VKIFLGYPSEHEKTAWEVYNFLKSKGDEVWFDKASLVAGTDWDQERSEGQRQAELAVHLCSEAILERAGVVNREIRQTLRLVEDQPLGSLYVIPIRLEPIKLPVELTRFQYFDFGNGWQHRLSDGVEKRRAQLAAEATESPKLPVVEESSLEGSQKVEFEEITELYECRGEYLRYEEDGLYWTYLNGAIASSVLESYFGNRSDFERLFDEDELPADDCDERKHEWSVSTEEFFRLESMLSIRFYTYFSYARAAHPNHYITTLNFFGEDAGTLEFERLIGHSTENAHRILAYCEKVIIAEFEGEIDKESFFEGYKEDEEDLWKLLMHFNFDNKGLTFSFSPYDVLPYVFGSHEIHVPWSFLEEMIAAEYKDIVEKLKA